MGMTHVEAADPAGEIDERVAVDIGQGGAARLGCDHREGDRERRRDGRLQAGENLAGARPGDLGLELDGARCGHFGSERSGALTPE